VCNGSINIPCCVQVPHRTHKCSAFHFLWIVHTLHFLAGYFCFPWPPPVVPWKSSRIILMWGSFCWSRTNLYSVVFICFSFRLSSARSCASHRACTSGYLLGWGFYRPWMNWKWQIWGLRDGEDSSCLLGCDTGGTCSSKALISYHNIIQNHNSEDLNLKRAEFISKPISLVSKILVISVGICFTPELPLHLSKFGVCHPFSIL
jgi:hypothetical protein